MADHSNFSSIYNPLTTLSLSLAAGQAVIRHCVETNESLPQNFPLQCLALVGSTFVVTGFRAESRLKWEKAIEWCGGAVERQVTARTSAVVAGCAAGPKIEAARNLLIPVVDHKWVKSCFAHKQRVEFSLHLLPALKGIVLATTGLSRTVTEQVLSQASKLGAITCQKLDSEDPKVTHLVFHSNGDSGQLKPGTKYHYAKLHGISVVSRAWVEKCVSDGRWASESSFEIKSNGDPTPKHASRRPVASPSSSPPDAIEATSENIFTLNSKRESDDYLRNSKIYFSIAFPVEVEPLRSMAISGGAEVVSDLSLATHILVGLDSGSAMLPSAVLKHLEASNFKAALLAHTWLETCCSNKESVDIEPYELNIQKSTRIVHLKSEYERIKENVLTRANSEVTTLEEVAINAKKRSRENILASLSDINFEDEGEPYEPEKNCKKVSPLPPAVEEYEEPLRALFEGCVFLAAFFHDEKVERFVTSRGGAFLQIDSPNLSVDDAYERRYVLAPHGIRTSPYYAQLQAFLKQFQSPPPLATVQWLEHVLSVSKLEDPTIFPVLFQPLPFSISSYRDSMQHVHICAASIAEPEKSLLLKLALFIGCATASDVLRPKSTTHVVSMAYDGKKQATARDSKKFVVLPEWLYCCARVGARVDEQGFLVQPGSTNGVVSIPSASMNGAKQNATSNSTRPNANATSTTYSQQPNAHRNNLLEENSSRFMDVDAERHQEAHSFLQPQTQPNTMNTIQKKNAPIHVQYQRIMAGSVIYFHKMQRSEEDGLKVLATGMGASISWSPELNVTHVVTTSKSEVVWNYVSATVGVSGASNSKKIQKAVTDHKPHYVAPQWLRECHEQRMKVSEAIYPAALDPRIALGISVQTKDKEFVHPGAASANGHLVSTNSSTIMMVNNNYISDADPFAMEPRRMLLISHDGTQSRQPLKSAKHSTSNGSSSYSRKDIPGVFVPKPSAQVDFEEYDSIDARYSSDKTASAPLQAQAVAASQQNQQNTQSGTHHALQEKTNKQDEEIASLLADVPDPISLQTTSNAISSRSSTKLTEHPQTMMEDNNDDENLGTDVVHAVVGAPHQNSLPVSMHTASSATEKATGRSGVPEVDEILRILEHGGSPESVDPLQLQKDDPSTTFSAFKTSSEHQEGERKGEEAKFESAMQVDPKPQENGRDTARSREKVDSEDPTSLDLAEEVFKVPSSVPSIDLQDVPSALNVVDTHSQPSSQAPVSFNIQDDSSNIENGNTTKPNLNRSALESQDAFTSSQSQVVDAKVIEEMKHATEVMRKLLASTTAQRNSNGRSHYTSSSVSSLPLDFGLVRDSSNASHALGMSSNAISDRGSRHVPRSEFFGHGPVTGPVSRYDSSRSVSSGDLSGDDAMGGHRSGEDELYGENSPRALRILPDESVGDNYQAPQVSYANYEPSEAVKSKLLGRAEQQIDSNFEENAQEEIRQMQLAMAEIERQQQKKVLERQKKEKLDEKEKLEASKQRTSSISSVSSVNNTSTTSHTSNTPVQLFGNGKNSTAQRIATTVSKNISSSSVVSDDTKDSPASDVTAIVSTPNHPTNMFNKNGLAPFRTAQNANQKLTVNSALQRSVSIPPPPPPVMLFDESADKAEDEDEDLLAALEPATFASKLGTHANASNSASNAFASSTTNNPTTVTSATSNIFAKAKRKQNISEESTDNAMKVDDLDGVEYLETKHADKAQSNASNAGEARTLASPRKMSSNGAQNSSNGANSHSTSSKKKVEIVVYISGFDSAKKKDMRKQVESLGGIVHSSDKSKSSKNNWTHFIHDGPRVTDKYLLSLAMGRWIVRPSWLESSVKKGQFEAEEKHEWRPSAKEKKGEQPMDPKLTRLAVAKRGGRGLLEGMKILLCPNIAIWETLFIDAGAKVFPFKSEEVKNITLSTIRSVEFVLTTAEDWDKIPTQTRTVLGKASVVVCNFFVDYLKTGIEPQAASYHPSATRRERS